MVAQNLRALPKPFIATDLFIPQSHGKSFVHRRSKHFFFQPKTDHMKLPERAVYEQGQAAPHTLCCVP